MEHLIYFMTEILYLYLIYLGFHSLLGGKLRTNRLYEISSYVLFFIATEFVYIIWNIPILNFVTNIFFLIIIVSNYSDRIWRKVMAFAIVYILMLMGETLALLLSKQSGLNAFAQNTIVNQRELSILARFFQLFLMVLVSKFPDIKKGRGINVRQGILIFLFFCGSLYLELFLFANIQEHHGILIVTNLVILLMNFLVIWIYDIAAKQYEKQEREAIYAEREQVYRYQAQLFREREKAILGLRHDWKNHILIIEEYLKREDTQKAFSYLAALEKEYDNRQYSVGKMWISSGNADVDSFVNYKLNYAESMGISCKITAKLPQNLEIDSRLMAIVLGNLLDNAITAAKETEKPSIDVGFSYQKKTLQIRIKNNFCHELKRHGEWFATTKKDRRSHGIGLINVKTEVERANGLLRVEVEKDNEFVVTVVLPQLNAEGKC